MKMCCEEEIVAVVSGLDAADAAYCMKLAGRLSRLGISDRETCRALEALIERGNLEGIYQRS